MKNCVIIFLLLLICPAAHVYGEAAPEKGTYTVERVIDAATLKLTNGEEVRLIGVEVPQSGASEATKFLNDLKQTGGDVRFEYDVERSDKEGKILTYVYISWPVQYYVWPDDLYPKAKGELFINATMMKAGYAVPAINPPNVKYADLFQELYEEARSEKRGLWKEKSYDAMKEYYESIDDSCRSDEDCVVKDVHNCCGYYPLCVNQDARTDPEFVLNICERDGLTSVCGYAEIQDCECVQGKCESAQ